MHSNMNREITLKKEIIENSIIYPLKRFGQIMTKNWLLNSRKFDLILR